MKKYLLPETGKFYKANLHCHSTMSDGGLTPKELKDIYMEKGYSIIAYTDHNILIPHKDLNDDNFLALHGFEYDLKEDNIDYHYAKSCHICFIASDPDYTIQPLASEYTINTASQYLDEVIYDKTEPTFTREYSTENINFLMQRYRDKGFFVTYNHPTWSGESYPQYCSYKGMHAFEIYNTISQTTGYDDYNPRVYDDILRNGNHIFTVAADDNHNLEPRDSVGWDSFGGYVMIKAEKLDYCTIMDALFKGNFYASTGPEIHSLWVEDGYAHITCSDAVKIYCNSGQRLQRAEIAKKGEYLNEAVFELQEWDKYVRFTVDDEHGKHANTNAYLVENILK